MTDSTDFVLGVVSSIMVAALLALTWATITAIKEALAQTQEPWCMKMNGCKTKCEDCPDEPPQHTERPVDCERCNRLEEQAYDLVGKLRVANIKLSMQPQRTWVGLTDDEMTHAKHHMVEGAYQYSFKQGALWAEAKLKELNT